MDLHTVFFSLGLERCKQPCGRRTLASDYTQSRLLPPVTICYLGSVDGQQEVRYRYP
jgi:hypothetical protein